MAAHGGDVADGAVEGFGADACGVGVHGEVDAGDEAVGFEESQGSAVVILEHGAVVAWAVERPGGLGKVFCQERDELVFSGGGEGIRWGHPGRRRALGSWRD